MVLAYCGLDCNECPVYLASIENNTARQIQLAREYSTDTCKLWREDMHCLGCHSDTVSEKMCVDCEHPKTACYKIQKGRVMICR